MKTRLLTVAVQSEHDVVLARQRARQIASLLELDASIQTRLATAVSEIARNAFQYGGGGRVEFSAEAGPPPRLTITVEDKGPGIENLPVILWGNYRSQQGLGLGIRGARRLLEYFDISSGKEGTRVVMQMTLPRLPAGPALTKLIDELARKAPETALTEVLQQNQELLQTQSELQDLNQRLRQADAAKDRFLAMLGHELRNLLSAQRSALEVLRRGPDPARRQEMEEIARRQADHLARLIDDLLDASKISQGKLELQLGPLEMGGEITRSVDGWRRQVEGAGLTLRYQPPAEPVWVRADATRLAQVLGNLISNACKFTDPGGEIRIVLTTNTEHRQVVVSVADTGCGLDTEHLETIFEPFIQTEESRRRMTGGLGLGLPIVKGLIEAHQGRLTASSEGPGKGTTFTFELPLGMPPGAEASAPGSRPKGATHRPPPAKTAAPYPARRDVLIIDDHEASAQALGEILGMEGHRVEVASSGAEALELLERYTPQVILCDLGLPGMDGFELVVELRRRPALARVPIYAVSGFGDPVSRQRALEAGFDEHLTKPVDFTELEQLLGG